MEPARGITPDVGHPSILADAGTSSRNGVTE
jgi:hypothetical protein